MGVQALPFHLSGEGTPGKGRGSAPLLEGPGWGQSAVQLPGGAVVSRVGEQRQPPDQWGVWAEGALKHLTSGRPGSAALPRAP